MESKAEGSSEMMNQEEQHSTSESEAHPQESSGNDEYMTINHRLIFATLEANPGELKFKECELRSALFSTTPEVTNLDHPFVGNTHTSVKIVGSCNELICVVLDGPEIFLWNPSTGDAKKLPNFFGVEREDYKSMSYGFGYDEASDDHKVVGITCDTFGETVSARIYSIRTNSWRKLDDFAHIFNDEWCYFLNGKLHWTAGRRGPLEPDEFDRMNAGQIILTLGLESEMCGEIEQPNYGENVLSWSLGILEGCLTLCAASSIIATMDIWVMKEYGVKESWTKVLSVPRNPPQKCRAGPFMKAISASLKDARFAFLYQARENYVLGRQILLLACGNKKRLESSCLGVLDGVQVYVKSSLSPELLT